MTLFTGTVIRHPVQIQIGFPVIPQAGSSLEFFILNQWLTECDTKHTGCRPSKPERQNFLPTRLIEVGEEGSKAVRLIETASMAQGSYVALSHPWGSGPHFRTTVTNLGRHKSGIAISELPATFKDAVKTTRALGQHYLWVDSLCIIQGPGGDFNIESTRMESVFSSAYCIIAACRAKSQQDGFLALRPPRAFVAIQQSGPEPFFICEAADNFSSHVLGSYMNGRGWVMQERALARRTIYFTDRQVYWECGDRIRCETLAAMSK